MTGGNKSDSPRATQPTSINNKSCAQCEQIFKKSQRSLNCNVCKYWFCIECSHISVKLYEILKSESTPNLPFNCDGCVRVLPKLNEIGLYIESQKEKFNEYDRKLTVLENNMDVKIENKVEKALEAYRDREERKCNVILYNVPEPSLEINDKKSEDNNALLDIFKTVKCREAEVKSFIRLGKPLENKPRLMKVTLDTVSSKHKILGGSKLLRAKNNEGYVVHKRGNIYITPDLSKEERDKNAELRKELERKKNVNGNNNLVIFRGKIVDKRDITGTSSAGSSSSNTAPTFRP